MAKETPDEKVARQKGYAEDTDKLAKALRDKCGHGAAHVVKEGADRYRKQSKRTRKKK